MPELDPQEEFITICSKRTISTKNLIFIASASDFTPHFPLIKQIYRMKSPHYLISPSIMQQNNLPILGDNFRIFTKNSYLDLNNLEQIKPIFNGIKRMNPRKSNF